ncbi:MAG: hypothetical protein HY324_01815, partial [Chlamydiia bacterium]|nr:hypothetical protein [Chlamydiia bacterium]
MLRTFLQISAILWTCLLWHPVGLFASETPTPVHAQLVSEEVAVQPGRPFWVGVTLKMDTGWDTYWRNPGDSGLPTQVNWTLPEGFKAGPLQWPYPQKIVNESLVAFGYTDSVLLMTEITPPSNFSSDQPIEIKADVNWLACKEACIPGKASLSLALPITTVSPNLDLANASLFKSAREALPQKRGTLSVIAKTDQLLLNYQPQAGTIGAIENMLFIPEEGDIIDYIAPQTFQAADEKMTLTIKRAQTTSQPDSLKGVLLLSEKGNSVTRAIEVDSTIGKASTGVDGISSVTVAIVLAFIGGLILNIMPCVLPVVALKIFSFVKMAGQRRVEMLKHGGVFSLGVLISFWVLSGVLLILRATGAGVGWGFQLQEPVFVVILASLLFLLGLSLLGVFEMGTSLIALGNKTSTSTTSPLKSSFMSGVLATLVATPCTGPLLGPALGFAMALPPIQALSIFTAMGLGMSFPYLFLSAFPKLIRFLPKPGNWMVAFKQIMGFLMMATVIWLVWVFGAQTDNMATFVLLAALLIMAIGAWIFGEWGALTRKRVTRIIATTVAAMMIFVGGGAAIAAARTHSVDEGQSEATIQVVADRGWEFYSPERVAELQRLGTPVFIDFTAKWCLICQANKVTLHSSE